MDLRRKRNPQVLGLIFETFERAMDEPIVAYAMTCTKW